MNLHLHRSEDGLALIYALFAVLVLAGLATLFVTRSVHQSRFTGNNRNYETAIHLAEAGADELIATHINLEDQDDPFVSLDPLGEPHQLETFASPQQEHDWAIARAVEAAEAGQIMRTSEGDFYGIRPLKRGADPDTYNAADVEQTVYGVGFVPSFDHSNRRVRVVKLNITRDFFAPDFALLTGADLKIGGNGKIHTPDCDTSDPDPDECDANVHANGAITPSGNSWEVHGKVTATGSTGSCPATVVGGCEGGQGEEEVPEVRARDFYRPDEVLEKGTNIDPHSGEPAEWFDLCPDGWIKGPGSSPCTGDEIWQHGSSGTTTHLGWSYDSGNRMWSANRVEPGIFYVYQADASINGSAGSGPRAVSVFVEGTDDPVGGRTGPRVSGSLGSSGNPNLVAAFPDALFVVDRDIELKGTGNGGSQDCVVPDDGSEGECDVQSYSGFITAWEQIDFSGNVNLNGAVLMQDREDLSDQFTENVKRQNAGVNGNLTLTFDRDLTLDLRGFVVVTHWNEL